MFIQTQMANVHWDLISGNWCELQQIFETQRVGEWFSRVTYSASPIAGIRQYQMKVVSSE